MNKLNKKNLDCIDANGFTTKHSFKGVLFFLALCFLVNEGYSRVKNNAFRFDKKASIATNYTDKTKHGDRDKKNVSDSVECLEIFGKFDTSVREFDGFYNVKLILENKVVATETVGIKKGFSFVLLKNKYYTIKIEKEGYISRLFSVSTKIGSSLNEQNTYVFSFETTLLSQDLTGRFEDDNVDFPFALISYNKTCDCFEHSKEYTTTLIQNMISDIIFGI